MADGTGQSLIHPDAATLLGFAAVLLTAMAGAAIVLAAHLQRTDPEGNLFCVERSAAERM